MKEWKASLAAKVAEKCNDCKIVKLKEVAAENGISHISTRDAQDIMRAAVKSRNDYRIVQMLDTPNDSLFQSIALVQNDVEFLGDEEFE